MKTIGLIGGMSWESSAEYYKIINETVKARLGGLHSAKLIMLSVDFHEIEQLQHIGDWTQLQNIMISLAKQLESAQADFLAICTNTMHSMYDEVQKSVSIPIMHIADQTGYAINKCGLKQLGLLGTRFTMEQDFYKKRLTDKFGIKVLIPHKKDRTIVHDIIYNELVVGKITAASKHEYLRIMRNLAAEGAQGIILGCTEIPLLIHSTDINLPLFDTTRIHAESIALESLD